MKFFKSYSLPSMAICLLLSSSLFVYAQANTEQSQDQAPLKDCLANAKKFEQMKSKNEAQMGANLQKAQDYYLCAEREGDTYAGYKAANLSEGGVARTLDKTEIIRLYTNAAEAGNVDAAYILSGIECGDDYRVCTNPQAAKKWLTKAAAAENPDALNSLGVFYKRGYEGSADINKAAACYKLAVQKGSKLAKNNLDELIKNGNSITAVSCL